MKKEIKEGSLSGLPVIDGNIQDSWRQPTSHASVAPAEISSSNSSTLRGMEAIREQLKTLPSSPGVYRMMDQQGEVLYVGKAKNLKKRLTSYTRATGHVERIKNMVTRTVTIEIITTHTEVEALLLESNLIKKLKPHFNVILRDDKSFPYILLRQDHQWAQIIKHRGGRKKAGEYFGPFASAGAVNRTINALQRAFPLRSCSDASLAGRTRPCLQYQIKRCTAPCVNLIDVDDYGTLVDEAREFLMGRSQGVQKRFAERMTTASEQLDFETAAVFRDRIRALTQIQAHQGINAPKISEADIIAGHQLAGQTCIQVFFIRAGQNYGNRAYFPRHHKTMDLSEVLEAFIGQFYTDRIPPTLLLLNSKLKHRDLIEEALSIRAGHTVRLLKPLRGAKKDVVAHASLNAHDALGRRLAENSSQRRLLEGVANTFSLETPPERIEVYDNSHTSGSYPVGSMIVAGPDGYMKNSYRRFTIRNSEIARGDDYGMLREVLSRRFSRLLKKNNGRRDGQWPDLVLIDGGPGQLTQAREVFSDLQVTGVELIAIAKGPDRNQGYEKFYMPDQHPMMLDPRDPVLYFLQRLRDEAHRFAIGGHRQKRSRAIVNSPLDEIPGVGRKRKRALLHHFGSARAVAQAGLTDLETVDGISETVAHRVYNHFHTGE